MLRRLSVFALKNCVDHSLNRSFSLNSQIMSKKVAVILAGSGVYDGSEIHESSGCLVHLSRAGAKVSMFAPDINQMHVINHINGETVNETRNVLVESARIARGAISPLSKLKAEDFDAVIIPGGFGAAKNLSNFAVENADCTVNPEVKAVITGFHSSKKPIGLCCIAPHLAARLIPGVEVTMGQEAEEGGKWPHSGATAAVSAMGGKHVPKTVSETHTDAKNKVVTTPAYMCNTGVHEIFDGVGKMVTDVLKLA